MTANSLTVCTSSPLVCLRPVVTPAPDELGELGKITSRSGGGLVDKIPVGPCLGLVYLSFCLSLPLHAGGEPISLHSGFTLPWKSVDAEPAVYKQGTP